MAIATTAAEAHLDHDTALFEPWQPWTHVLVQQGWWQLAGGLLAVMAAGFSIEGELGGPALMIACLAVLPLAAAGGVIASEDPGISSLALGLLLVVLGRAPRSSCRWGLSYYAITEIGHLPLCSVPMWLLALIYLVQEAVRCLVQGGHLPLLAWFGAIVAGLTIGVVSRRLLPPASQHQS